MYTLLHLAFLAVTFVVLARVVPGVHIKSYKGAAITAVVFSVLNFALAWALKLVLFLPGILTFGLLFLVMPFIVTTVILWLTDEILDVLEIKSFRALLLASGGITLANLIFRLALHR